MFSHNEDVDSEMMFLRFGLVFRAMTRPFHPFYTVSAPIQYSADFCCPSKDSLRRHAFLAHFEGDILVRTWSWSTLPGQLHREGILSQLLSYSHKPSFHSTSLVLILGV